MAGIFKRLSANDIKITPFEAHKTYSNTNLGSIGVSTDFISWAPYNKVYYLDGNRKYSQIDKLYYRDYIRERAYRLELDDATYTTQERRLYDYANVISFPQKNFGNEIQPSTFILSCSYSSSAEYFDIRDDGFGNLYDNNKGRDNFPNEDYRILYVGPTQAFKRADLTIDYETGNKYVNNSFLDGYTRTVYDDSYFLNEIEFNRVNFVISNNSGFYGIKTPKATEFAATTEPINLERLYNAGIITVAPNDGSSLYSTSGDGSKLFDGNKTSTTQTNTYNIDEGRASDVDAFTITFSPPLETDKATIRAWVRGTESDTSMSIYINDNLSTSQSFLQTNAFAYEQHTATFNEISSSVLDSITFSATNANVSIPYHQFAEVELDIAQGTTLPSFIKIPHQPQFNFETSDDFTINFYYDLNGKDRVNSLTDGDYFILTKEGTKTVASLPSEKTRDVSLRTLGSSQIKTVPVGNQFPYRIYYKGNYPSANTSSIFFERSDGETTQFVSASFFTSGSTETQKFISCKNSNGQLLLQVNNVEERSSNQNSPTLNKTVSNKADITLYNKPNPDGSYSNYIGYSCGQISQLMMWNQALSSNETTNVSESIVGTPNIGNIFYDNGFAVVTHPSYKNILNNYDFNGFDSVVSASISSSALSFDQPDGGTFNGDGTKLILSSVATDNIVEFTLNTPYDVTTITTSESISNSNIEYGNIYGLTFNNDGSKFYTVRNTQPQLLSYFLSSSYDLRSAYNKNSVSPISGKPVYALAWSNDGNKLFTGDNDGNINLFVTPSPFNINKITLDHQYNVGHTGAIMGIRFDNSGYRLFITHKPDTTTDPWVNNASTVTQYILDRPFDLRSLNETNRFNSSNNIYNFGPDALDNPSDILFNNDGTKAYIILGGVGGGGYGDGEAGMIWQFNLPQHIDKFEYKNTHLITENEYQCTMTEDEFEFTTNPTARKIPFRDSEDVADFTTGSNFKPYITSVGLYDDMGNLLVVGKLAQPIKASSETDTTFVIRYDT